MVGPVRGRQLSLIKVMVETKVAAQAMVRGRPASHKELGNTSGDGNLPD